MHVTRWALYRRPQGNDFTSPRLCALLFFFLLLLLLPSPLSRSPVIIVAEVITVLCYNSCQCAVFCAAVVPFSPSRFVRHCSRCLNTCRTPNRIISFFLQFNGELVCTLAHTATIHCHIIVDDDVVAKFDGYYITSIDWGTTYAPSDRIVSIDANYHTVCHVIRIIEGC